MRIVISAGDPSGDVRAGELLMELAKITDIQVSGLGGRCIQDAGGDILFNLDEYSVMGFAEVLTSLGKFRRLRHEMRSHIESTGPDVLLLVDYPGFNIPLAGWAKKNGYKVIYYISPQLWAWGRGRVKKIRRSVDLMITLFGFEVEFYLEHGVRAVCSGHPLADSIPAPNESSTGGKIAYLPGSRRQEVSLLLRPMIESFVLLRDSGTAAEASIAVSPDVPPELYNAAEGVDGVSLDRSVENALNGSSAAVVCSGTATLETAMWGVPFVITYRTSGLTYFAARMLVRGVSNIGMANLVTGIPVATELIQKNVTADRIRDSLVPLLSDTDARRASLSGMKRVRDALGKSGSSARAARFVLEESVSEKT